MKRYGWLIILLVLTVLPVSAKYSTAQPEGLQMFLLKDVTLDYERVTLGNICIMQGEDTLVNKAAGIGMGLLSAPGQKLKVTKQVIKSRLASNGFDLDEIKLLGSNEITVSRRETVILAQDLIDKARVFAKVEFEASGIAQATAVNPPKKFIAQGDIVDISLIPRWSSRNTGKQAVVEIDIYNGSKKIGTRRVTFNLKFYAKRAIAAKDISAGEVFSNSNIKIQTYVSDTSTPPDWQPPYGMTAKSFVRAGRAVKFTMAQKKAPQVMVKKNEFVSIKLETKLLVISAMGRAMQDGRVGEYIQVVNINYDSLGKELLGRPIMARVSEDGTVEPVH